MSHMTADTVEELHEFAARIGLKRSWAQLPPEHWIPHYDVSDGKRLQAIRAGAVEEDWRSSRAIERHRAQRLAARTAAIQAAIQAAGQRRVSVRWKGRRIR